MQVYADLLPSVVWNRYMQDAAVSMDDQIFVLVAGIGRWHWSLCCTCIEK